MPTARKTRRLLVLGVLVGVGAFALWPSRARLEWHSTVIVTGTGRRVQVGVMVPAGWGEDNSRSPHDLFVSACTIRPPVKQSTWLPRWLNDRLFGQPDRISSVVINPWSVLKDDKIHVAESKTQIGSSTTIFWTAGREVKEGGPLTLGYVQTNRAAFKATYRQICESFRIIQ